MKSLTICGSASSKMAEGYGRFCLWSARSADTEDSRRLVGGSITDPSKLQSKNGFILFGSRVVNSCDVVPLHHLRPPNPEGYSTLVGFH